MKACTCHCNILIVATCNLTVSYERASYAPFNACSAMHDLQGCLSRLALWISNIQYACTNDQSLKHVSIVTKSETLGGKTKAYIRLRNEWYTCMVWQCRRVAWFSSNLPNCPEPTSSTKFKKDLLISRGVRVLSAFCSSDSIQPSSTILSNTSSKVWFADNDS